MLFEQLHERALVCVKNFKQAEGELISILQEIDNNKAFRALGYSSLYQYSTVALKLSESQSYALITVARKAKDIPELKIAISSGKINTSQARRITAVITKDNKDAWIDKASRLSQRELEKEIASIAPKEAVKEKMTYVTESRVELKCGISEELMKEIERVKDLLSQRTKKPCSVEGALQEAMAFYLEKHCPIRKAHRALARPKKLSSSREHMATIKGRPPIPSEIKHQVMVRDMGQCTYQSSEGKRCEQKRWVHLHHKIPLSDGGTHTVDNLLTLCLNHHQLQHELNL